HEAAWIPDRLELTEGVDEVRPEHLRQELGFRLTVAVFAGERSAIGHYERARIVHERLVLFDARRRLQIEVDASVDAALTEVSVQGAGVSVLVEQLPQVAQVVADTVRRNRRVLPSFPDGKSVV